MNQQQLGLVLFGKIYSPGQGILRSGGKVSRMNYPADQRHRERPGLKLNRADPMYRSSLGRGHLIKKCS